MKIAIFVVISLFIILLAGILPLNGSPVWYGQYLGLLLCLFVGISLFLWNFNPFLSIFTILCVFSTFFITNISPRAIILLIQLYLGYICAYGLSKFNQKQRKIVLRGILSLVFLQCFWLILQLFNKDPIFKSLYNYNLAIVGLSGSKDQLGSFFALITPVLMNFHPLLIFVSIFGLVLSKSSFAFMAAIIGGLLYYRLLDKKKFKFLSLILVVFGICFVLTYDKPKLADFGIRANVWNYSIKSVIKGNIYIEKNNMKVIVNTNPLFGYGFGNYLTIFPYVPQSEAQKYFNAKFQFNCITEKFTHAHNDFVEYFFELGWLGLFAMIGLVLNFIWGFIKSKKSPELILYFSSIVVYLLNSTGNFLSQMAMSGAFLIIFYGFYMGVRRENGQATAAV